VGVLPKWRGGRGLSWQLYVRLVAASGSEVLVWVRWVGKEGWLAVNPGQGAHGSNLGP
jgi:hypothetical protein